MFAIRAKPRISRCARNLCAAFLLLVGNLSAESQEKNADPVSAEMRAQAANFPLVELSPEPGAPKYQVFRLNVASLLIGGARYGAVRLTCPSGAPMDLLYLFSDPTNIDQYNFIPVLPGKLGDGDLRLIYPAAIHGETEEAPTAGRRNSSLPRPWDLLDLHLHAIPAPVLVPGESYILWFKFSDRRPTDILFAALAVPPNASRQSGDLPTYFGLPAELGGK